MLTTAYRLAGACPREASRVAGVASAWPRSHASASSSRALAMIAQHIAATGAVIVADYRGHDSMAAQRAA